jgi:hypothetical protein
MTVHVKWPSIEAFHNLFKSYFRVRDMQKYPKMTWKSKIKLHGTNAAVQYHPASGKISGQKRTGLVSIEDDNAGFALWVAKHEDGWREMLSRIHEEGTRGAEDWVVKNYPNMTHVVHGEWAGPGIQKNTSLTQVKDKFFAVFAVETSER